MYLISSVCILLGPLHGHNVGLQLTGHANHPVQILCDPQSIADGEPHKAGTDRQVKTAAIDPLHYGKQGCKQDDQVPYEL